MEPQLKGLEEKNMQKPSSTTTILNLNDDCLLLIFSYVSSVQNLIVLDRVCSRFRNLTHEYFYWKHTAMEVHGNDLGILPGFLVVVGKRLGPHVSTLKIAGVSNRWTRNFDILYEILNNCTQLEHVILDYVSLRLYFDKIEWTLQKALSSVRTIRVINCIAADRIGDWLKSASKLEFLSLDRNRALQGCFLPTLKNQLKTLELTCNRMLPNRSYFDSFCQDNLTLENLTLFRVLYCAMYPTFWEQIANLQNLKCLKLDDNQSIPRSVPNLSALEMPNLKQLEIHTYQFPIFHRFLTLLAADGNNLESLTIGLRTFDTHLNPITDGLDEILPKFKKLKVLHLQIKTFENLGWISAECRENLEEIQLLGTSFVTNDGLLQFIRDCPKLKVVDLRKCSRITNTLVFNLVPIFNKKPQEILKILAHGTQISENIEEQLLRLGNKNIKVETGVL